VLDRLECAYGDAVVLHGISLSLTPGEILCLVGRNGAGKTTTLKAIMGLVRPRGGSVRLDGRELTALRPYEIPRFGVAYVPQGRGLFPLLTIEENLRMGLLVRGSDAGTLAWVLDLFPVLRGRLRQRAGTLSGGEQQMVAMGRALCTHPRYLLMDEPTEGLMPVMIQKLAETIGLLRDRQVGVLFVEQKIDIALAVADRVALMEHGRIEHEAPAAALAGQGDLLLRYLGVARC
jgi:branched-chain amino acid transport system ATP-binding protein